MPCCIAGGVRASRFASSKYGAKVAVVELPFGLISSEAVGGAGGTYVTRHAIGLPTCRDTVAVLFVAASHHTSSECRLFDFAGVSSADVFQRNCWFTAAPLPTSSLTQRDSGGSQHLPSSIGTF